jgi:hypothetical protein
LKTCQLGLFFYKTLRLPFKPKKQAVLRQAHILLPKKAWPAMIFRKIIWFSI